LDGRQPTYTGKLITPGFNKYTNISRTLLYAPFTPLIVLFCYILESGDAEDLKRLEDFISSLQPSCTVSDGIDQLCRLAQVLYNVASIYVEAQVSRPDGNGRGIIPGEDVFHGYLNQLGLMTRSAELSTLEDTAPGTESTTSMQIGDWFTGHIDVLGLMEEDLGSLLT
jgi:hypothetical protein